MTAQQTLEQICLVESETVVERGKATVRWLVRQGNGWVSAARWPGATIDAVPPGAGTVWERRIELRLPRGTRLQRVLTRPGPTRRLDPLEYLRRAAVQAARSRQQVEYRVEHGGRVVLVQATTRRR